jgi:hypothetical protein
MCYGFLVVESVAFCQQDDRMESYLFKSFCTSKIVSASGFTVQAKMLTLYNMTSHLGF